MKVKGIGWGRLGLAVVDKKKRIRQTFSSIKLNISQHSEAAV